ncbi:unnamed protein product, partial [Heterotrigona itama]
MDVTVPFENIFEALEKARIVNIAMYQPLADALAWLHCTCRRLRLGAWNSHNEHVNTFLRISSRYAALMRKLVMSETISFSQDTYVEHVWDNRKHADPRQSFCYIFAGYIFATGVYSQRNAAGSVILCMFAWPSGQLCVFEWV